MPIREETMIVIAVRMTGERANMEAESLPFSTKQFISDDDEDETAELQRELEKIKRERAEKRAQEVRECFSPIYQCRSSIC